MKTITILALFLWATQALAQEKYPRIEQIQVTSTILDGYIDGNPIKIFLKFGKRSNYHLASYSVEGWYYYTHNKIKIPLAGVYDYPEVILYNFSDTAKSNQLIALRELEQNPWKEMEYYTNLEGYREKFVLTNGEHYLLRNNKKLSVHLIQKDLIVRRINQFLVINPTTAFDLLNFRADNFKLIAHQAGKYILSYQSYSNDDLMGRCGGQSENGLILLTFDQNNSLVSYETFVTESCYDSISSEEEKVNEQTVIYHFEDYRGSKSYQLKVDLNKMTIEKVVNNR